MGDFGKLRYMILAASEAELIDFNQVFETSEKTLRYSLDGLLTFVKWEGNTPKSVDSLPSKLGPYKHTEMLEILNTPAWTPPTID